MLVNTASNIYSTYALTNNTRNHQANISSNIAKTVSANRDTVSISPSAFNSLMAEKIAGQNLLRANALNDSSSATTTQLAYDMAHANLTDGYGSGGLIDISKAVPGGPVNYTSGEPVTIESQAYFTQQATAYQKAAVQLYDSAEAKGASAGEIVNQLFDLQSQQSGRFKSMMMWTPTS
jgi:nitrogen fixation/metabolism regulation signal transduction histidine kinase